MRRSATTKWGKKKNVKEGRWRVDEKNSDRVGGRNRAVE